MTPLRFTLTPRTAFGTRPLGDTLFGQLCWALRNRYGEERLNACLDGYTAGRPFAVVSDAFPAGHLPRPALPTRWLAPVDPSQRKQIKQRVWLPVSALDEPVARWPELCQTPTAMAGAEPQRFPQPHNTLDRGTGTTGTGPFAPYTMEQLWYGPPGAAGNTPALEIHTLVDESRLSTAELHQLWVDIGRIGFGRDASIGLGKFEVTGCEPGAVTGSAEANAWLTLAPCAPQGLALDPGRCFYQPFVRFGRHGDVGVLLGNPFKTPLLLAQTGAVLTPSAFSPVPWIGQGLGGDGSLSKAIPETVHQGYAPVVGIRLPQ